VYSSFHSKVFVQGLMNSSRTYLKQKRTTYRKQLTNKILMQTITTGNVLSRKTQASSCEHCCCGKAMCVIYSECLFLALLIEHAKRMCNIILTSVASPALSYFSTLSHQQHNLHIISSTAQFPHYFINSTISTLSH